LRVKSRAQVFHAPAKRAVSIPEGMIKCPLCPKPVKLSKRGKIPAHKTPSGYECVGVAYMS